ncbi:MAG: penicillin-binding protein 2 [Clostridia bacterium]|nr:penicillin-binding protein 2 [Clostridia bacterium]
MSKRITKEHINLRFNIMTLVIYLIGTILIIQLFNLQIIHGKEYREQSNTRLSRESVISASRGDILDRSGNVLATVKTTYSIELYKTNIKSQDLNNSILELIKLLDKNGESYIDTFPININPFEYTISDKKLEQWKEKYKIDSNATPEEAFNAFKEKYKITNENIEDARKIMIIRYRITTEGYSNTKSILISSNIKEETVAELSERNNSFAGITINTEATRTYTSGSLASHILGYIGKINEDEYEEKKDTYRRNDVIGRTGIESVFETYLKGKDGIKQIDMTVDGTITAEYVTKEPVAGSNVVLTIDANLQRKTEAALKENIEKIASGGFSEARDTKCGSAVVMKVDTGEILAMASYPDYEPEKFVGGIAASDWNAYRDDERKPLINRAIQSSYAPGSIFKMVTATAGLETGVVTINETIYDTGKYKYSNDYQPECWYRSGHGYINVMNAIKKSCNYYFYEVGNRLGIDRLSQYAKYFGLGRKTGIELTGETAGTLASREAKAKISKESWQGGETLSAAIGQSYNSFTPLQMAKYMATFVNGGKEVKPTIIKSIINNDLTEENKEEIRKYSNQKLGIEEEETTEFSIKQEYLQVILEGMRSVTNETGGTAYSIFKNFNIEVGGKTGSAQAGKKDGKDVVHAWFMGFAPFDKPEIAVVVMVEDGSHGSYSAEVVREIMEEYFGMNSNNVYESTTAIPYMEQIRN